jgi:GNAT superfamily N-acetyltransferase
LRQVETTPDSDEEFEFPENFWDDVPERIAPLEVEIPELASDSDLVKAFPELQNLTRYGGATYEANLQAAAMRYRLINDGIDRARIKIRALNMTSPILGANYDVASVDAFNADSINENDLGALQARITVSPKARRAAEELKGRQGGISTSDLKKLMTLLRYDDPNKPVEEVIAEALKSGVVMRPASGSISSVGEVVVPFKIEDGVIAPAIDTTEYKRGLGQLDQFMRNRQAPATFNSKSVRVKIAATQQDFESQVRAISPTDRDYSGTQGITLTVRPDGTEATISDARSGLTNGSSVILLNHEFAASQKAEFGEGDSIAETLAHEYGHTVHQSMGLDWGYSQDELGQAANPKTKEYDELFKQDISGYGANNYREHFAESFASFISANPNSEFEKFLEEQAGFKKFDISSFIPDVLRGRNLRDQVESLNSKDLGGYSFRLTSFTNPYENKSEADLAQIARRVAETGRHERIVASWKGTIYDSQGRSAGTFTRTLNRESDGTMWIYHDYFKMEDSAQGDGFGRKFISESFDLYKDWGVNRVEVTAALENGPYMWGIMGFDFMSETDRQRKLKLLGKYDKVLNAYNEKYSDIERLSDADASRVIYDHMRDTGTLDPANDMQSEMLYIIRQARNNGWNVDNNFLNELKFLLSLPQSQATAQRIASLGRRNKKTTDKTTSSIGRMIMMEHGWRGRKYL